MPTTPAPCQTLRNRKPPVLHHDPPPVPPKADTAPKLTTAAPSLSQRRGVQTPEAPRRLKPLPPVPLTRAGRGDGGLDVKPLPRPPGGLKSGTTALWIAAFVVWFLLIVVMLPVVMEREAMIGMNAWLRGVAVRR